MSTHNIESSSIKVWDPLGAAMVIILLLGITLVSVSGMALIATEGNGPLAGSFKLRSLRQRYLIFDQLAVYVIRDTAWST